MKKKFLASLIMGVFLVGMVSVVSATTISEVEANNTLSTAQNLDNYFSIGSNVDIYNSASNPWVSVMATGNGSFDYYSFTVEAGTTGWFDIDYGMNQGGSIDTEIALWDSNSNVLEERDDGSDYQNSIDSGTIHRFDPSISYYFATAGTYIIGVAEYSARATTSGWSGGIPDSGDTYTLQVSLSSHDIIGPGSGSANTVPEPATMFLFGIGLLGIAGINRKKI